MDVRKRERWRNLPRQHPSGVNTGIDGCGQESHPNEHEVRQIEIVRVLVRLLQDESGQSGIIFVN